jgi:hypothetical protein
LDFWDYDIEATATAAVRNAIDPTTTSNHNFGSLGNRFKDHLIALGPRSIFLRQLLLLLLLLMIDDD